MNLEQIVSAGEKGGTIEQPLGGKSFSDAQVLATVSARLTTKTNEKNTLLTQLASACAQAEREEVMLGSGSQSTGTIRRLVQQITLLEGQIEYLTRAVTGLGG